VSGLLLLGVLWALAAVVVPWLVRGRSLATDIVTASAWAAGLASGTAALAAWLGFAEPRGLVAGAVVAGVAAVAGARMGDFAHVDGE
jgi:eukaryotic-like serine/threonine-protein kinase